MVEKLRKPILDVKTRWNSVFDMLERLLELRNFYQTIDDPDVHVLLNDELWVFMAEFVDVFKPIKIVTLELQSKQVTLGDFFKHWLCD